MTRLHFSNFSCFQIIPALDFGCHYITSDYPSTKLDFKENHQRFLDLALGDDLNSMLTELDQHLMRGMATLDSLISPQLS